MSPHNRFLAAHEDAQGPGDARPTALDIINTEGLTGKLNDKVILITGASANLGVETALALATTGAKIFCTARDLKKAEGALASVIDPNPSQITLLHMDQTSLASVRSCAAEFLSKSDRLNILICNAGIMATPELTHTSDGHELQFATNHLSHFLLFQLLKSTMLASSTPTFNSRVVMVSSSGHRRSMPQFGNYDFKSTDPDARQYAPFIAYGQSKTANIYTANEIDRRYGSEGLHGLSLHPGGIQSNLQVHMPDEIKEKMASDATTRRTMKSPQQGAATQVYAAVSKEWEGKGGVYLEDCDESPDVGAWKAGGGKDGNKGHEGYIYDVGNAKRLWGDSLVLVEMPME